VLSICFWKAEKGEEVIARFLEALDDRGTAQPPLLREADARLIDERAGLRVDHAPVNDAVNLIVRVDRYRSRILCSHESSFWSAATTHTRRAHAPGH